MIKILITVSENRVSEVECKGHSGYSEAGSDIVCSAVSSIIQTSLLGLIEVSKSKVLFERKDGYLKFAVPKPESLEEGIRQEAILRTMILGLRDVQGGYKAFIKMEER